MTQLIFHTFTATSGTSNGAVSVGLGLNPDPNTLPRLPTFSSPSSGIALLAAAANHPLCNPPIPIPQLPSPQVSLDMGNPVAVTSHRTVVIPPKLVKRILDLEFIEMNELLPEAWGIEAPQPCCQGSRRPSRRAPVSDIMVWVECFSTLVAVLASKYPQHVPDFMAYQKAIVRASRNFEGSSWVVYDRCYRRQAAATKNLVWSIPDSALYNEAFTGRAKAIPHCQHCLSENHTLSDCPDCPLDMQREHRHQQDRNLQIRGGFSSQYCQLFNQIRCRSRRCKYQHLCNLCSLPHPAQVCPMRGRGQRDRSRPSSPRRGRDIPKVPMA